MEQLISNFNPNIIFLLAALITMDMAMGAAKALKEGYFDLQRLADVFTHKAVPFGISMLVLEAINVGTAGSSVETAYDAVYTTSWLAMAGALAGSIAVNVKAVIGKDGEAATLEEIIDTAVSDIIVRPGTE